MTSKKFPNIVPEFLSYVLYETQSSRESTEEPSTPNQLLLAEELVTELKSSGLRDAHIGKGGVVYGTLPATRLRRLPGTWSDRSHGHFSGCSGSQYKAPDLGL